MESRKIKVKTSWNKGLKGVQVGYWKGKKRPDISRAQLGKKYPGRKLSEAHKRNISLARTKEWASGKRKRHWRLSQETIEKMRLSKIGRKASIETRTKQSKAKIGKYTGDKHWNWKGGISKVYIEERRRIELRLWRESVFARDGYTCLWCGARNGNGKKIILNADHIKPFALFPELRFAIDNGRTLCRDCHLKTDTYGGKTKKN